MRKNTLNIIGRGASLKDFDFTKLNGDVMAINHLPQVDKLNYVVYWDRNMYDRIKDTTAEIISIEPNEGFCDICYKNRGKAPNFNDGEVGNVNLSGWIAINAALKLGYTEIYLFGYDGGTTHGTHYDVQDTDKRGDSYKKYNDDFNMFTGLADIHNVINPEMKSNLVCFPNITYDEYYQRICEGLDGCAIVDIDSILQGGSDTESQTDDIEEI